mgnify:CR=1 FL=1
MKEWNEIDAQCEREYHALNNAFKRKTPRRGVGRSNRSALSREYRVKMLSRPNLLAQLNVIDGKVT